MDTSALDAQMADRKVLSVHTKPETSERLGRLAKLSGRTKSSLANEALETFLEHQEWMAAEIEKGLADARAGRVIAHEEIRAWAASLGTPAGKPSGR